MGVNRLADGREPCRRRATADARDHGRTIRDATRYAGVILTNREGIMRFGPILIALALSPGLGSAFAQETTTGTATAPEPELDACRASGLIALKEKSPAVKDVSLDLDTMRVHKSELADRGCNRQSDRARRRLCRAEKIRQGADFRLCRRRQRKSIAHHFQQSMSLQMSLQ